MKKKTRRIILISILSLLILFVAAFIIYTQDYYRSDKSVETLIELNENITSDNNITTIIPQKSSNIGLIFYPGGKVDYKAYIPLLDQISKYGITCYLVKMPFNLAVFNKNAASKIIDNNKEITSWYLAGHSLGGAMASSYCKENYSRLDGLILLAAYPLNDSAIDTLSISGTNDLVLTHSSEFPVLKQYKIQGGNHANFGNYGTQKGDGIAEISREEQQEITKNEIIEFIKR